MKNENNPSDHPQDCNLAITGFGGYAPYLNGFVGGNSFFENSRGNLGFSGYGPIENGLGHNHGNTGFGGYGPFFNGFGGGNLFPRHNHGNTGFGGYAPFFNGFGGGNLFPTSNHGNNGYGGYAQFLNGFPWFNNGNLGFGGYSPFVAPGNQRFDAGFGQMQFGGGSSKAGNNDDSTNATIAGGSKAEKNDDSTNTTVAGGSRVGKNDDSTKTISHYYFFNVEPDQIGQLGPNSAVHNFIFDFGSDDANKKKADDGNNKPEDFAAQGGGNDGGDNMARCSAVSGSIGHGTGNAVDFGSRKRKIKKEEGSHNKRICYDGGVSSSSGDNGKTRFNTSGGASRGGH